MIDDKPDSTADTELRQPAFAAGWAAGCYWANGSEKGLWPNELRERYHDRERHVSRIARAFKRDQTDVAEFASGVAGRTLSPDEVTRFYTIDCAVDVPLPEELPVFCASFLDGVRKQFRDLLSRMPKRK